MPKRLQIYLILVLISLSFTFLSQCFLFSDIFNIKFKQLLITFLAEAFVICLSLKKLLFKLTQSNFFIILSILSLGSLLSISISKFSRIILLEPIQTIIVILIINFLILFPTAVYFSINNKEVK